MTKCKENIKAKFENNFRMQLGPYEKCLEMSDESPEKFKAECKAISEEFQKNILRKFCEGVYPNDQDLCEKYAKYAFICTFVEKGMGVLGCPAIVKVAADFFEGEQKTCKDKINDLVNDFINDPEYIQARLCQDYECVEKFEYVYQTLKKFKESCEENNKNIMKEYEEIESTIDMPTELMKSLYKEMKSEIEGCEARSDHTDTSNDHTRYLTLGDNGKLYIKEVLKAFYPDLYQTLIDKITDGFCNVEQFGITINNYDNGKNCTLTGRGSINKDCFPIPPNNDQTESYNLKSGTTMCSKHIFDSDTHIIISKARGNDDTIDKTKPLVTISQSQPLMITDIDDGKLVAVLGFQSNMAFNECKEFCDKDGRIDCTGKKEECYTCKELMWDYQGPEIPVYMHGYSPEML